MSNIIVTRSTICCTIVAVQMSCTSNTIANCNMWWCIRWFYCRWIACPFIARIDFECWICETNNEHSCCRRIGGYKTIIFVCLLFKKWWWLFSCRIWTRARDNGKPCPPRFRLEMYHPALYSRYVTIVNLLNAKPPRNSHWTYDQCCIVVALNSSSTSSDAIDHFLSFSSTQSCRWWRWQYDVCDTCSLGSGTRQCHHHRPCLYWLRM